MSGTSFNHVVEVGRLTRDPELRETPSGHSVANFSIAVNRIGKNDDVDFFDCEVWRDQATNLVAYKKKGDLVLVNGWLKHNPYTDKDGNNRSKIVIVANTVTYFPRTSSATESEEGTSEETDDIPF